MLQKADSSLKNLKINIKIFELHLKGKETEDNIYKYYTINILMYFLKIQKF